MIDDSLRLTEIERWKKLGVKGSIRVASQGFKSQVTKGKGQL